MSPAASTGPRGYRDYQRVVNWDGPIVLEASGNQRVGKFAAPVIECSRYAYLAGVCNATENQARVNAVWSIDEAGTIVCGERTFIIGEMAGAEAQLRIPNMGPWLKLTFTPTKETTIWRLFAGLFLSNRSDPRENIPQQGILLEETHNFVGAGSEIVLPKCYWSGTARCYVSTTTGVGGGGSVEGAVSTTSYKPVDFVTQPGIGVLTANVVIPLGSWRFLLQANAANEVVVRITAYAAGAA